MFASCVCSAAAVKARTGADWTGAERADRAEAKTRHAGKNEFNMRKSEHPEPKAQNREAGPTCTLIWIQKKGTNYRIKK